MPVLAPEGTAARPSVPSARITSTSTVGLPRLSRISRPRTVAIGAGCVLIVASRLLDQVGTIPEVGEGRSRERQDIAAGQRLQFQDATTWVSSYQLRGRKVKREAVPPFK